jgi:hypothetical protein
MPTASKLANLSTSTAELAKRAKQAADRAAATRSDARTQTDVHRTAFSTFG